MTNTLADVLAAARAKAAQNNKQRTVKPPVGRSVWRILPGWRKNGDFMFYHEYGQHFVKDAKGDIKAILVCPEKTFGKPCDICDMITTAAKHAPDDQTRERILESRAAQSYLVNAIRLEAGQDSKNEILALGTMLFNQLLEIMEEHNTLLDPAKGLDLVINREGSGINTKYTMTPRSAEKSKPVPQSVVMSMIDLDEYVKEDAEAKWSRALETIGSLIGIAGPEAAPMLSKPATVAAGANLDDEIPAALTGNAVVEDAVIVEEPAAVVTAPAAAAEVADVDDEELAKLLAGL